MSRKLSIDHLVFCAAAVLVASVGLVRAQNPDHARAILRITRASTSSMARGSTRRIAIGVTEQTATASSGVDLRSGKFRNATTDQQLRTVITNGFPTAGMPAFTLDAADLAGLVAYLRNMNSIDRGSLKPGDAARGRMIVETKGACLSCHRINGKGSRKAPNLSDIGANRSAGSLERSLLDPTSQMWPINRPVRIVTKDGKVINGRRLNEDTYTVQIADEAGRLISLNKSDLREFTVSTKSTMPSYKDELTTDELSDVVTYLLTLKGHVTDRWRRIDRPGHRALRWLSHLPSAAQTPVPSERLLNADEGAAELVDLRWRLLQPALQPADADHAGEREDPEPAPGPISRRTPAAGRRRRSSSTASCI